MPCLDRISPSASGFRGRKRLPVERVGEGFRRAWYSAFFFGAARFTAAFLPAVFLMAFFAIAFMTGLVMLIGPPSFSPALTPLSAQW
jgi:hypothetical protein